MYPEEVWFWLNKAEMLKEKIREQG